MTKLPVELKPGTKAARDIQIDTSRGVDEAARTVELAFSSEEAYERWWGVEILDHKKSSVRLERLKKGGALLLDHDHRDHVGVIESVRIDADKVARAVVRFGKSARASEVFQDVLDGIRRNVSVGYRIHEAVLESEKEGVGTYRVTDWEPFEVSLVSVPADTSVGVGRSDDAAPPSPPEIKSTELKEPNMTTPAVTPDPAAEAQRSAAEQRTGAEAERKRVAEILAIGELHAAHGVDKLAREAVASGTSLDAFREIALKHVATKPVKSANIGMDAKEVKRYSLLRALNYLANPRDAKTREAAAFEIECSMAAAERSGKSAQGLMVPYDVLKRDLTVGTATAGGHTVATDLLSGDFIELLRNAIMLPGMGARVLTGLVGNIAIPRQTGAATHYWVAESGEPLESQQAFNQLTMSPKTVGAFTDISRKLLLQSSIDVESFVQGDLAKVLGLAIQAAAIQGGGVNEPTGILGTAGIGSVAGGANGAAPTWGNIIELETDVAVANADVGALAYLTNAKVRGKLKSTEKFSTTGNVVWADGNTPLNGYKAAVTNAVPSNLTKGSSSGICSAIIFGNFADLVIGMWGGLDLTVDPYSNSTSGTVRIVALQDVDVAVRHAESFSAMLDALTT